MLIKSNSKLFQTYKRFRSYLGRPKLVVQTKPVIISDETQTENPIFLIGIHRSGTSLVRRIVNSHSNIACPPETFFLEHFAAMVRTQHTFAGFRGLGIEQSEALNEIRLWASRHHEAFRMAQGKKRWADKTPQYVGILPEIEEIFGTKTQYIMIFRHPLDVVYSIFQRGWKFGDYDPNLLVNTAKYVEDSLNKQLNFSKKYPQRCFDLKYENLVSEPSEVLTKMFDFLGEPWEPEVLNFNDFNHGFGTEDPFVRGTKGFLPNIDNWKTFSQEQLSRILPILEGVIKELGYSLDNSKFPSYTKRL